LIYSGEKRIHRINRISQDEQDFLLEILAISMELDGTRRNSSQGIWVCFNPGNPEKSC